MSTLADRIDKITEALGITGRELARRSGIKETHLGVLLKRLRSKPGAGLHSNTMLGLARGSGVRLEWLQTGTGEMFEPGMAPGLRPPVESPAPPPTSDTFVSNDKIDALFDEAVVPGQHLHADVRLVSEVVCRHSNLLREGTTPVDYVRKLLDVAAKCRESGRKVTADELYDLAFGVVAQELATANRQLREAQARLDAMMAEARKEADRLGVKLRDDGTPHPALVAGIAAAKAKRKGRP